MILIAGLGNPDREYCQNRHNIGFMVVDKLGQEESIAFAQKKFNAHIGMGQMSGRRVILMKPNTYMNLSGDAVSAAVHFYKILPENILVIHDDIDLSLGRIKVKMGGGHAGHNGVRSIMQRLGENTFPRIRVGIGRPNKSGNVIGHVLGNFSSEEKPILDKVLRRAVNAARTTMEDGVREAMNLFNQIEEEVQ